MVHPAVIGHVPLHDHRVELVAADTRVTDEAELTTAERRARHHRQMQRLELAARLHRPVHAGADEPLRQQLALDARFGVLDNEAVEHAARPRLLDLLDDGVADREAIDDDSRRGTGRHGVHDVDGALTGLIAATANPSLHVAALDVALGQSVEVLLPFVVVEWLAGLELQILADLLGRERRIRSLEQHLFHVQDHALGSDPPGRIPSEGELVPNAESLRAVVARDAANLEVGERIVAHEDRGLAALGQVLRQRELDLLAEALGKREPRHRVLVLQEGAGVLAELVGDDVAAIDAQRVEADLPAGRAESDLTRAG